MIFNHFTFIQLKFRLIFPFLYVIKKSTNCFISENRILLVSDVVDFTGG